MNIETFRLMVDAHQPCWVTGKDDEDSVETFYEIAVEAHLPDLEEAEPGDLLRPLSPNGWQRIASIHVYTRPLGDGRIHESDIEGTCQQYVLDVSSGAPQPAPEFGEAAEGSVALRISRFEFALAWRGRGLGLRTLRSMLDMVGADAFVLALDAIPTAPQESLREDGEAIALVENFWASAGFTKSAAKDTAMRASRQDVLSALETVPALC